MRRPLLLLASLVLLGLAAFWYVTRPDPLPPRAMAGLTGDPQHGKLVFWAGGCASCHAAKGATGADRLKLGGGQALVTAFGTFHVPHISPDPKDGLGDWTLQNFGNALGRLITQIHDLFLIGHLGSLLDGRRCGLGEFKSGTHVGSQRNITLGHQSLGFGDQIRLVERLAHVVARGGNKGIGDTTTHHQCVTGNCLTVCHFLLQYW